MDSCRLCTNAAPLCESHIIPEFMFKGAYDSIHRAHELKARTGQHRYLQKGYREPMLCHECEMRVGQWEKYVADNWFTLRDTRRPVEDRVSKIAGLEYEPFRLFHLSVLWRAHTSTRQEFQNVRLGPHAATIARLLLRNEAPEPTRYPFWAQVLVHEDTGEVCDDVIVEPTVAHYGGQHVYTFVFGGAVWYYYVSSHRPQDLPTDFDECGELLVLEQNVVQFEPLVGSFVNFQRQRLSGGAA